MPQSCQDCESADPLEPLKPRKSQSSSKVTKKWLRSHFRGPPLLQQSNPESNPIRTQPAKLHASLATPKPERLSRTSDLKGRDWREFKEQNDEGQQAQEPSRGKSSSERSPRGPPKTSERLLFDWLSFHCQCTTRKLHGSHWQKLRGKWLLANSLWRSVQKQVEFRLQEAGPAEGFWEGKAYQFTGWLRNRTRTGNRNRRNRFSRNRSRNQNRRNRFSGTETGTGPFC